MKLVKYFFSILILVPAFAYAQTSNKDSVKFNGVYVKLNDQERFIDATNDPSKFIEPNIWYVYFIFNDTMYNCIPIKNNDNSGKWHYEANALLRLYRYSNGLISVYTASDNTKEISDIISIPAYSNKLVTWSDPSIEYKKVGELPSNPKLDDKISMCKFTPLTQ